MSDMQTLDGELAALSLCAHTHDLAYAQVFGRARLALDHDRRSREVMQLQTVHADTGESSDDPVNFNRVSRTAAAAAVSAWLSVRGQAGPALSSPISSFGSEAGTAGTIAIVHDGRAT